MCVHIYMYTYTYICMAIFFKKKCLSIQLSDLALIMSGNTLFRYHPLAHFGKPT